MIEQTARPVEQPFIGRARRASAAALALVLVAGGVFLTSRRSARMVASAPTAAPGTIPALQQRLREVPNDFNAWAALGAQYVQQARITADPSYYPKAESALRRSLAIRAQGNADAMAGMGALAAARHDFAGALRWGERALAIDPYSSTVYGVIGDALIELGRYPPAFASLQRMVDLRPGLPAYARASYAWELQGDRGRARAALMLALNAASTPNDAAFASTYLGELAWSGGDLAGAQLWYVRAQQHDPSFVAAIAGLAKVAAARGETAEAIRLYNEAIARTPAPQYVIDLGDLYATTGHPRLAQQQYDLWRVQVRLFHANGVDVDLEQALFAADHHVNVIAGLQAARREWSRRQNIGAADAMAWALYANGRADAALPFANEALRLGTRDAMFLFHRGMIERALGMRVAGRADIARAVRTNPHFSLLWASTAEAILR